METYRPIKTSIKLKFRIRLRNEAELFNKSKSSRPESFWDIFKDVILLYF
jgi:hypothetical protein